MKLHNLPTVFMIIVTLISFSCKTTSASQKGKISGEILLHGETDHSGVTVMIFPSNQIPDDIAQIVNQHYSEIRSLSAQNIFDHRKNTALYQTTTDPIGHFQLPPVLFGNYIITVFKEGWGYRYYMDVMIDQEQVSLDDIVNVDDAVMYREVVIPAIIPDGYVLESNKCYVVDNTPLLPVESEMVIQKDARVLLKQNSYLNIYGFCEYPTVGYWFVTSYSGLYDNNCTVNMLGGGIRLYNEGSLITNAVITFINDGLIARNDNLQIQNSLFMENQIGLSVSQTNSVDIRYNVFIYNDSQSYASLFVDNSHGVGIRDNVFYTNYTSILTRTQSTVLIDNNAFIGGDVGVLNSTESVADLTHNLFQLDGVGVANTAQSNLSLEYNVIVADICVRTFSTNNYGNTTQSGFVVGQFNNLSGSLLVIKAEDLYLGNQIRELDWSNNYWSTTSIAEIQNLIVDSDDLAPSTQFSWSHISFLPIRMSSVSTAGLY